MKNAREQWRERVAQWRASGQTAREFAARRGLNVSTLPHWAWRFGREVASSDGLATVPTMIEIHAQPVVSGDEDPRDSGVPI